MVRHTAPHEWQPVKKLTEGNPLLRVRNSASQAECKKSDPNAFTRRLESGLKHSRQGSKRKRQKAGLNKSILDVGFGTLNKMITYKVEAKGGLALFLPTRKIKPSQRCPQCGTVHKDWANLSNRYHVCNHCNFENGRDKSSVMVMYNVACQKQPGLGTHLESKSRSCGGNLRELPCSIVDLISSTSKTGKHTGSMKQLGEMKRQKSQQNKKSLGPLETPTSQKLG